MFVGRGVHYVMIATLNIFRTVFKSVTIIIIIIIITKPFEFNINLSKEPINTRRTQCLCDAKNQQNMPRSLTKPSSVCTSTKEGTIYIKYMFDRYLLVLCITGQRDESR
jgi:hypothetical protein